jgi:Sensors of blue-light using FAD
LEFGGGKLITQLVYISESSCDPNSERGQILLREILTTARRRNAADGITGYLLVGPNWFAQVLEGPSRAVSALFHRLLADPRHSKVQLVDTRLIAERRFSSWTMEASVVADAELEITELLGHPDSLTTNGALFNSVVAAAESASKR